MYQRLRALREEHHLTQQQVASYLMCDLSLYYKYERGQRGIPLYRMIQLANLYGTSIDYLVGLTDNKTPYER